MKNPLVVVKNATTGYDSDVVLRDASLEVFPSDFIGIIGPNGGGKTTFVKTILGIVPLFSGEILFPKGKPVMGYLPQVSQIDKSFPITVKELVSSGLKPVRSWFPHLNREQKKRVMKMLDEAGLSKLASRPIGELSGGQLQKALLSRAIIRNPDLLILDEPNTFVDKSFEKELYNWLEQLNKRMAILLISHDIGTISPMVKSIACINVSLHYHHSNVITEDLMKVYNCPVELISHGPVPHRVLKDHRL